MGFAFFVFFLKFEDQIIIIIINCIGILSYHRF